MTVAHKIEALKVEYVRRNKDGWIKIIKKFETYEERRDVGRWCRDNGIVFFRLGRVWMFEQEQDATMFALRWA